MSLDIYNKEEKYKELQILKDKFTLLNQVKYLLEDGSLGESEKDEVLRFRKQLINTLNK